MSARILAGRGAMFGTLAARILLAVVIAALLHLMEPRAPLLLIGVAVAVTLGLLPFVSSRSAVLLGPRWYAFNGHLVIGLLGMAGVAALGRILCARPTDWLSLASFAAVIALAYGALAYFIFMTRADREPVSSVLARRSAS